MATMACYPPFDQSNNTSSTQVQQQTSVAINNNNNRSIATTNTPQPQKDYSKPLHVDCSVEYELPNQARPPGKSEPLLMIHPCFYRRAESQRRSPFINNLPQPVQQQQTPQTSVQTTRRSSTRSTSNNASQVLLLQQQQQQRYAVQQQQQQQLRYMEQVQVAQQQQAYQQTMVSSAAWSLAEQNPAAIYCKPPTTRTTRRNSRKTAAVAKELAQLSRVPDYTSSGDSGISGVLWTDAERSPAHTGLGTLDTITLPTPHPLDKGLLNTSTEASQQPQSTSQQQSQQQATPAARRTGYSLRSDASNSTTTNSTSAAHGDLAELLAAACGADHLPPLPKVGVAPGKTQVPSQPQSSASASHMCQLGARCGCTQQSRASLHQQPAVGVAAVASCRSCRPTQAPAPPTYQQHIPPPVPQQQQPWPAQFAHPPAAVPASACEPGPEPASSSASGQVRRSWSRSTNGAKRSRVSSQQPPAPPSVVTSTPSWVSNPFLETSWQQTTSCGLGSNNNNNNSSKDCGAMCKVCCPTTSLTPQQQQQQQQQQTTFQAPQEQQQWNASYYCRSEDAGGRMMWNNENMLRLFQV